jgi:hypothetical protein
MVPEYAVREVRALVSSDEDILLRKLGGELIDIEARQGGSVLGLREDLGQLRRVGEAYLESQRTALRAAICGKWASTDETARSDAGDVGAALLGDIADTLHMPGGGWGLWTVLTAIVVRRGLNALCA